MMLRNTSLAAEGNGSLMKHHSARTRPLGRTALGACLGLGLALTVMFGCDDGPGGDAGDVAGTWSLVSDSAGAVYLRIDAAEIEIWVEDAFADCFRRTAYQVIEIDGTRFEIANGADTLAVHLRRDADQLILTAFDDSEAYAPTDIDPGTLPVCAPETLDVVCADQPLLAVGDTIERTLSPTDPQRANGSHMDLYRFDVAMPGELVVEMSSEDIDSSLALYDADGDSVVAANDDASELTLDARIEATLDTGCWILVATSAGADEFGDYRLSVSNP